eukprot:scaffold132691_cov27-Prasinocladus_malaysianus.AAC.2
MNELEVAQLTAECLLGMMYEVIIKLCTFSNSLLDDVSCIDSHISECVILSDVQLSSASNGIRRGHDYSSIVKFLILDANVDDYALGP